MSIQSYFGMTGSGKSYNAVANILVPALNDNRTVVTNLPLRRSALFDDIDQGNIINLPSVMTSDNVHEYLNTDLFPPGCVFILDECFSLFPSGQKANNVPTSLKEFFSMHRHIVGSDGKASDIYILAQNIGQLAAWLRDMIQSMVIHTDLAPTGLSRQYRCDFYQFELHGTRNKEKFIQSSIGTIKEPYINYYISNSKTEAGQNGDVLEKVIDKRTGLGGAHKKNIILASVLFLLTFVLIAYSFSSVMPDDVPDPVDSDPPKGLDSSINKKQVLVDESFSFPIPNYSKPFFQRMKASSDWRLTGIVASKQRQKAIIRSLQSSIVLDLLSNCYFSEFLEDWACLYNDELVAFHTGPVFDELDSSSSPLDAISDSLSFGL